jgi:hypothetical protein
MSIDDFFERIRKSYEEVEDTMSKLRMDPCMDIPKVGDFVIVAASPLGMGFSWVRLEAEVLFVANNSYKVRFHDRHGKDKHSDQWIDPVLVLDIVSKEEIDAVQS